MMNILSQIFVFWLFITCFSLCEEVEKGEEDTSLAKSNDGNSTDEIPIKTAPKTGKFGRNKLPLKSAVQKTTGRHEKKLLEQVNSLGDKTTTPDDIYLAKKLGQVSSVKKQPSSSMSDLKKKIKSFGKSIKSIKSELKSELNISTATTKKRKKRKKPSPVKGADSKDVDDDYKIDLWRPGGNKNSTNKWCVKEKRSCYVPLKDDGVGLVFPCCSPTLKCDLDVKQCVKRSDIKAGKYGAEKNITELLPNFKKMRMKFKLQYD